MLDKQIIQFLLYCLTPTEEWEAHGGFDDFDDDECTEYDGSGLGQDDPDDWISESDE